jgi:hypothetical protein
MTKFGIFSGIKQNPDQVIEGDYLLQDGDIVKVFKSATGALAAQQVGAFNLDKRQVVRQVVQQS